jgi:hypothetical protein
MPQIALRSVYSIPILLYRMDIEKKKRHGYFFLRDVMDYFGMRRFIVQQGCVPLEQGSDPYIPG